VTTAPQETPIRVLFLCTANSARSQIAEALLVRRAGQRFVVASAGTHPAGEIHPEAIVALQKTGIDWSGHRPKGLDGARDTAWDFIITTCDRVKETCPAFPGQPIYAHWSVPDPAVVAATERPQAFRDTVSLLSWRIDLMLALRPELLSRAAAEQRLRSIGMEVPHGGDQPRENR
jgi:protein-tyrosine-phosphatase